MADAKPVSRMLAAERILLLDGGVDPLPAETIFDALNAKTALESRLRLIDADGNRVGSVALFVRKTASRNGYIEWLYIPLLVMVKL